MEMFTNKGTFFALLQQFSSLHKSFLPFNLLTFELLSLQQFNDILSTNPSIVSAFTDSSPLLFTSVFSLSAMLDETLTAESAVTAEELLSIKA